MATSYIVNDKGERTGVIIPVHEFEDLIHQNHLSLELTNEYKQMIDDLLNKEANGDSTYLTFDDVKTRFGQKWALKLFSGAKQIRISKT